jgi:hypothetical protein
MFCGYVCALDRSVDGTVLVWSEGKFFRVPKSSFDVMPYVLSPLLFKSDLTVHPRSYGKPPTQTFSASFEAACTPTLGTPPQIKGFFSEATIERKVCFNWNPHGLFPNFIKCSVWRDSLPQNFKNHVRLNVACDVCFSLGGPSRSHAPFPFVSQVSSFDSPACVVPGPPAPEPLSGSLDTAVFSDLRTMPLFNAHAAFGLPENSFIPTCSFSDFKLLGSVAPVTWEAAEFKIFEKYNKAKSSSDPEVAENAKRFLARLGEHKNNASTGAKNILIVAGVWSGLDWYGSFSLAERILQTTNFGVFVVVAAHPLSTLSNAHELNPHFFGNFCSSNVVARFFSETPIGTAEFDPFSDNLNFSLARNAKKFIFLQMKKAEAPPKKSVQEPMFAKPIPFEFATYKGPLTHKTGSFIAEQFILFSVESAVKNSLFCFPPSHIPFKLFPDPHNFSPFFLHCQLYSAEDIVTREQAFKIYASAPENSNAPLIASAFCESGTVVGPCSPENRIRILKIASLDSLQGAEGKAAVVVLLNEMNLAREIFPLSRFYYKILLSPSTSDSEVIKLLKSFNTSLGRLGPLFHSLYDGTNTHSLIYRPPPPKPKPIRRAAPSVFIIYEPPLSLSLSQVSKNFSSLFGIRAPCWGTSPSRQSCIIVEFFPDDFDFPPYEVQEFNGEKFAVRFFSSLPPGFFLFREKSMGSVPVPLSPPPRRAPVLPKFFFPILDKLVVKPPTEDVKMPDNSFVEEVEELPTHSPISFPSKAFPGRGGEAAKISNRPVTPEFPSPLILASSVSVGIGPPPGFSLDSRLSGSRLPSPGPSVHALPALLSCPAVRTTRGDQPGADFSPTFSSESLTSATITLPSDKDGGGGGKTLALEKIPAPPSSNPAPPLLCSGGREGGGLRVGQKLFPLQAPVSLLSQGARGMGGGGSTPKQPDNQSRAGIAQLSSTSVPPPTIGVGGKGGGSCFKAVPDNTSSITQPVKVGGVQSLLSPLKRSEPAKAVAHPQKGSVTRPGSPLDPVPRHPNAIFFKGVTPCDIDALPGLSNTAPKPRPTRPPPVGLDASGPSSDVLVGSLSASLSSSPLKRPRPVSTDTLPLAAKKAPIPPPGTPSTLSNSKKSN